MLSIEEARARILATIGTVGVETISVADAWGRVLAAPVVARLTQPPSDVSAMDGFAVRAADAAEGARLRVVGAAPAGRPFDGMLKWGEAVRLYTGSVMPAGADSVVLQEDATAEAEIVLVNQAARPGQHVRRQGQDFSAGDTLLSPGRRLGARDVGLAAAGNHPWLTVYRRPRAAILATGDEIHLPGEVLRASGIVSSNTHVLAALMRAVGAEASVLPVAGDSVAAIRDAAFSASGADILVTTGGASVGAHDLVQAGLAERGFALDFWKIAMRPGKPMIFGQLDGMPVVGLPGNPVSAFVCAVIFVLPALRLLAGLTDVMPQTEPAFLGAPVRANDRRADFLRARLARNEAGALVATPFDRQDSALQTVLAEAGALIHRPPFAPALPKGDLVSIIRLDVFGF